MKMLTLKPAAGRKVRHPETMEHLPEGGAEVVCSSYWLRRLQAGDVVEIQTRPAARSRKE